MLNKALVDSARFHLDNPALYNLAQRDTVPSTDHIQSRFLSRYVRISSTLFPEIDVAIKSATAWLLGENQVISFISSDENINAACLPGPNDQPIIWLSSGLVKTLSLSELRYVVGHELGHWYFRHFLYEDVAADAGPAFIARQQLSRASEITCDRIGLLSCGDLDLSLRAVLKTASGLPEEYIGPRISEFINQTRSLGIDHLDEGEVYATHPPMAIRARALVWFAMSDHYGKLTGSDRGGLELSTVNERVEHDLSKILGKGFSSRQRQEFKEAVFWMTIYELVKDGDLTKREQDFVRNVFGSESLEKLRKFITGRNKGDVIEDIRSKALAANESITAYSRKAFESFLESNVELAKFAEAFITRFS